MNVYKELRIEKGLTQFELSKLFLIDQTTVSKWELGKAVPDVAMLCKIADFFDVSTDYLLGRTSYFYPDNVKAVTKIEDDYTSEERQIIDEYRKLPDTSKVLVRRMVGIKETAKK